MSKKSKDLIQHFLFENLPVRGVIVHLEDTWLSLQGKKNYPDIICKSLGEFAAANALLASTLKFDGSLIMQIMGNGLINLLVMECTNNFDIRGLAKYESESNKIDTQHLFGDGKLVLTINNDSNNSRYQSIIELHGDNVSLALEQYLTQSEQLETCLILATNNLKACGILLQKLPNETEHPTDDWNRLSHLVATIKDEELFNLNNQEIIHRLFSEDDIRLLEAKTCQFNCTCSRKRVADMLITLGKEEVNEIIEATGTIDIDCEYCNQHYSFDSVDVLELFATNLQPPSSKTKH